MTQIIVLSLLILVFALISLRKGMIDSYKIGYYEQRLKNKDIDISHVENMTLLDIWRL